MIILPWFFRLPKFPKTYYCKECGIEMDEDKELCDECKKKESEEEK